MEVGSESTGLEVTGGVGSSLGGSLGLGGPGRGGSLRGPGGGSLGGRLGSDGLGVSGLSLVVGRSGLVDGGGSGGGRVRGGLGSVGSTVWESGLLEGLGSEHGGTTVGEELGSLLAGTSDFNVSGVVCISVSCRVRKTRRSRLTGHVGL